MDQHVYGELLDERIIMVVGAIEPYMANEIKASLLYLEAQDPHADITMYIDSPGGEVVTGMGIYDTMQYIMPDVRTVCLGLAASMGSVILMGGAKGKRYSLPNSQIMIHQPSGCANGMASDIEITYRQIQQIKDKFHDLYVEKTGQPKDVIISKLDRDTWMTPQEALEFGIIDEIMKSRVN